MTLEQHTRKQVQMHAAARAITYRCYKSIKEQELFGLFFSYNNVYFSRIQNEAVTVERFIPGVFTKYINNTGLAVNTSKPDILMKAEALCHFSYIDSETKLLLLDIQGVGHQLFDPEIATAVSLAEENEEKNFCTGNLNEIAIETFFTHHKCNIYCEALELAEVEIDESSSTSTES